MKGINEIIGQESLVQHMEKAIGSGKISHAYLIDGENGAGKKTMTHLFARSIFCEHKEIRPCDKCPSCLRYIHHNHPDVIEIDKDPDKTMIGIDQIRQGVIQDMKLKPYEYPYKVYIIHQAHLLTEQAQNAILKTLEEPPEYVVIFLLSENMESFLPTIRSRCVTLKMSPVTQDRVEQYLVKYQQVVDYHARLCARFSRGNIGKAIRIAQDERFSELREMAIKSAGLIVEQKTAGYMKFVEGLKEDKNFKEDVDDFLDLLLSWFRDMLFVKSCDDKRLLIHEDKYSILKKQAENTEFQRIDGMINQIEQVKDYLEHNVNFTLAMDTLFFYDK